MKAFFRKLRFHLGKPGGHLADGRMIGIGLSTALKSCNSAEDAESHLTRWAAEERARRHTRAGHGPRQ